MSKPRFPTLVKLSETDLPLKDPAQDLRDRKVVDKNGDEIGDVKDVLIDEDDQRVRFLLVGAGGFLGIGEDTIMIPADAITRINPERVQVDFEREHTAKGPRFDPALSTREDFWAGAYDHYGYLPFWAPGYRAPAWPGMP